MIDRTYKTTYFRVATQGQVPDEIVKNIRLIEIDKYGVLTYGYLRKRFLKWKMEYGQLTLGHNVDIPNHTLLYMRALTQGKVKDDILKHINNIVIRPNQRIRRTELIFTYTTDGVTLNGRIRLEGFRH